MSKDLFSLSGKVAAVSGCTRGIGQAMAIALAEAGADVCLLQRNLEDKSVYDQITALGRQCYIVHLDANDQASVRACIGKVLEATNQKLDILVNNAGIAKRNSVLDFLEEDWDAVIQCNLKSVYTLSQAAGKHMVNQKSGKIINTASLLSFQGGINAVAYASAKGGIATLTKALANEWAQYNVNVNAIAPGYIATDMTAALRKDESRNHDLLARIPAKRYGTPEDLKGPIVFLASRASDYVNGELLLVDGGWMGR